ncbi:hypothetical protein CSPX01_05016 [Colletotrichum filicis]|nr:hypothetical protein CSPX01_05016 [Colletotrichum filicis]
MWNIATRFGLASSCCARCRGVPRWPLEADFLVWRAASLRIDRAYLRPFLSSALEACLNQHWHAVYKRKVAHSSLTLRQTVTRARERLLLSGDGTVKRSIVH